MAKNYKKMDFKGMLVHSENLLIGYILGVIGNFEFKEVSPKHPKLYGGDGLCDEAEGVIYINKKLSKKEKFKTILHESLEALTSDDMFDADVIEGDVEFYDEESAEASVITSGKIYYFNHDNIEEIVERIFDEYKL